MQERHRKAIEFNARVVLTLIGIPLGTDFHTLRSDKVERLLAEAIRTRYQAPKGANGSRARYFHDYLQRLARRSGR